MPPSASAAIAAPSATPSTGSRRKCSPSAPAPGATVARAPSRPASCSVASAPGCPFGRGSRSGARRLRHQPLHGAGEAHGAAVEERHGGREAAHLVDPLRRPQHGGAAARRAARSARGRVSAASGSRSCVASSIEQHRRRRSAARGRRRAAAACRATSRRSAVGASARPTSASTSRRACERGAACAGRAGGRRTRGSRCRRCAGRTSGHLPGRARPVRAPRGRLARAEHAHAALGRVDEPRKHAQQRGLAGPVRAEQRMDLARVGGEVDTRQCLAFAEAAYEAADLDGGRLGT